MLYKAKVEVGRKERSLILGHNSISNWRDAVLMHVHCTVLGNDGDMLVTISSAVQPGTLMLRCG
jgi:hypothetical protein